MAARIHASITQFIYKDTVMLGRQNGVLSALQGAEPFLTEHADALTGVDLVTAHQRLDDVITSFTTHAVEQNANDRTARGETAKQQQLRQTLRTDVMRPVAEIARRDLRTTPEYKALQMPRHVVGPAFIASANGMLQAATIHKDALISRGMPTDFLDQFQAGITKLEESMSQREKSRTRRIGATQGLLFQEQEGRSVLKVLDAQVRRALRGNAALLATWEAARTIHRRPGGSATTPSTTTQSTTAQATGSTTPVAPAA